MTASVERLGDLHSKLTERLIVWAESEDCTPPMAAVIATFLKTNGIIATDDVDSGVDALRALLNKPKIQAGVQLTADEKLMMGMV